MIWWRSSRSCQRGERIAVGGNGVKAVRLSKAFGSLRAIEDVSIEVKAGEIRGLVGANGAGKTTVVSCITGVLTPDSGHVLLGGTDAGAGAEEAETTIGVVGQRTAVYGSLSVQTNLRFFAQLADPRDRTVGEKVRAMVDALQLQALLSRPVCTLSVGQQRLVHIASALVHRPRVVVLDEPTAGLDFSARRYVFELLEALARDGAAVMLSTHHLDEVENHCDAVTILHKGRTIAEGDVEAVIDQCGLDAVFAQLTDFRVDAHGELRQ